jgi:hypothetical protein
MRIEVIFGIAGCLCFGVSLLSPVMAQTPPACTVTASAPSTLVSSSFTSFGAIPKAVQSIASSAFTVSCAGNKNHSGSLKLSILANNTYNGTPQFRVASIDRIFTSSSNESSNSLTIPFSTSGSTQSGKVYYQVLVSTADGMLLRSARDYLVTIKAELTTN